MLGHALAFLRCCLLGHADPIWEVGRYGVQWRCPSCMRVQVSPALRRTR